jgi:DNA-binding beta-propeller fold protein YncE/predicted Ser/Thr protein kinase
MTFGKYTVIEEIGRGGMGIVYKATDSILGRTVAVKELVFGGTTTQAEKEESIARFRREAQTAALLSHPNIVTIYDVGDDGGRHFMAMEFLTGRTLKQILERGERLPLPQMLDIVRQCCVGLDHAHSHGVVHRDIKPDNVLLQPNGTVKIMDFGIARQVGGMSSMTQTGTMLGTLAYISPEQLQNSKEVDGRADIFSFGCMLYEMFTGVLPFDGGSIGGTILKIITEEPKSLREHNPSIPPAVDQVVLKCLNKLASDRYQRAGEILKDLEPLLGGSSDAPKPRAASSSCSNCGHNIEGKSRFCPNCGAPQGVGGSGPLPPTALPGGAPAPAAWQPPPAAAPAPAGPPPAPAGPAPVPAGPRPGGASFKPPATFSPPAASFSPPAQAEPGYTPAPAPEPSPAFAVPAAPAASMAAPAAEPSYGRSTPTFEGPSPYETPAAGPGFGGYADPVDGLRFLRTFGRPGSGKGEFFSARGIAVDPRGYVLVADTQNGRVQFFDRLGQWHHVIGGDGTKGLKSPCGVAVDSKGQVWVIDSLDSRVRVFDTDGHLLGMFCEKGTGRGQFTTPGGIAISGNDMVVISDPENYRLQLLDIRGQVKNVLGRHGTRPGEFRSPYGVACDANDRIYVIDYGRPQVQVLDKDGISRLQFGSRGADGGQFSIPRGIGVAADGRIIVADTLNHRLQIFDPQGNLLLMFGNKGSGHGQFMGPETLAVDNNELYVLDKGNNRVQVFSLEM